MAFPFISQDILCGASLGISAFNTNRMGGKTFSGGNLTVTSADGNLRTNSGTVGIIGGKVYFEVTVGTFVSGISTICMGWIDNQFAGTTFGIGTDTAKHSFGVSNLAGNWQVAFNNVATSLGAAASSDVICIAIDTINGSGWARKNAGNWNNNASANPSTNVGGINISAWVSSALTTPVVLFPAVQVAVNTGSVTANFGGSTFAQAIPSGYNF